MSGLEDLQIRPVRIDDAADISRIQAAITSTPIKIDFKRVIKDRIRRGVGASFVAEVQGNIVGYMISYTVYAGFGIEKSAWIATLGVDPKFMGKGIGQTLAREVFRFYREKGVKKIFTSVSWDSVDLLSFFKTLGFDRSNFINLNKDL